MTSAFGVRHRNHGDRRIRLREFVIIDQGDDGKVVGNRVVPLFAHLIEEKGILMIADDKAGKSPPCQKIGEVHIL